MEELRVPKYLRAVAHRLYEEVKVKIRTSAGISASFRSDIEVKQGAHGLLPILVYISTSLRNG